MNTATVKCPVCAQFCDKTASTCSICGSNLTNAKQNPVPASVFKTPQQNIFQQPMPQQFIQQNPFGAETENPLPFVFNANPQKSGFDVQPAQKTGFNQQPPISGFGIQPTQQSEFVQPEQYPGINAFPSGFGMQPVQKNEYQPPAQMNFGNIPADDIRFAETLNTAAKSKDSVHWSFGAAMAFLLQMLIPIYGLIVLIGCLIGNPRKYPADVTNFLRASFIFTIIISVIFGLLFFAVITPLLSQYAEFMA